MSKWASGVGMLLCASMALGQSRSASTTDRPAQTAQTARPAPTLAQPSAGAGAGAATAAPVTAQEAMTRSKGSLLRASIEARRDPARAQIAQVSFYAVPEPEPRVLKKHDLVTIIVREESEFESEANTETTKEMTIDSEISELIKINLKELQINPGGIGDVPLAIRADLNREFSGEGSADRKDKVTFRIQAEVIDVKPNDTVVLQARKRIKTDEEEKEIILSGICRAQDVTIDNTVLSTQLFDQELVMNHRGAVRDASKRGAIPRLLDFINPF